MSGDASAARTDSVFDRAKKKVSIEDYLKGCSVKLVGGGKQLRGPCILCDGGTTKFKVEDERFYCFGCEKYGDVVELVALHRRCEPYTAARWLLGEDVPVSAPAERKPVAPSGPSTSDKVAAEILDDAKPFAGSLAERYLLGRGIDPQMVALAALNLRYHGSAKHHWDDALGHWVRAPAMVATVVTAEGPTGGAHVTYLDRATGGKAAFKHAKLMWGPQALNGKPGGAWLIGPELSDIRGTVLIVAEGIETSLSIVTLAWRKGLRMRAAAALSLNRLQGGVALDADKAMDVFHPAPEPKRPPFAWPIPEADPWPEVMIAVDRDMSEVKVRARTGRGRITDFTLTAEARAKLCGRLAVKGWLAAGAPKARAIAPSPGHDFNDDLRRVLARESRA